MKKIHALALGVILCLLAFQNQLKAQIPNLVISEIMYNPPETGADSLEFVEIYNNENTVVDLSEIYFSAGINHTFSNQTLEPNSYLVLAKDSIAFQNVFGAIAYQWDGGTLGNSGELLEIKNANNELIDAVEYGNANPWSVAANGLGASLVLCDFNSDNSLPENWMAATTPTEVFINNEEIIANPNEPSTCPIGPIIGFIESSINVIEDNVTIDLQVVIEDGNANPTEVVFGLDFFSTGTLNEDFSMSGMLPLTIEFAAGIEKDTQIITIQILEDFVIEQNELLIFELQNPTNDAIINPMHASFEILIEDDDSVLPDLVISEIMYNPPEEGVDSTEYIELYNNDTVLVNLVGYYFSEGVAFTFPEVFIEPGEYIVIARDSNAFASYYGFVPLQWSSGTLINSGELIELRNLGGNVAATVEYDNTADWSLAADGEGASLVLCNPNLNNNDPANWNESISSTGIVIDGVSIFADPAMGNNCLIPLSPYPLRSIGEVTMVDSEGIIDSLGESCQLQGIVYGVNLNASNGGTQFVLIDENGDGITVYSGMSDFGYPVVEKDEIIVQGKITQFNGLAEIIPDTLWMISSNNALTIPQEVLTLDESTESQLIEIKNLSIINPSDWDNSSTSGFSVDVTNGVDTFEMRIDQDVDLYEMDIPNFSFNLTGLGGQYDFEAPYLEGYQILPRYFEDLEIVTSDENVLLEEKIQVYPNPVNEAFTIEMTDKANRIQVDNFLGQTIFAKSNPLLVEQVQCATWGAGIYLVRVFYEKKTKMYMIVK